MILAIRNVISLGYFCSIASNLEKMGYRNFSSPFDWCISDWKGIELALESEFLDFLDINLLYQNKNKKEVYVNRKYGIAFYHDFDKYKPLSEQLEFVKSKYNRRCIKFMNAIKEPTLFIRYIKTESNTDELKYIEDNTDKINALIKSYNQDNEIVYILDERIETNLSNVYKVKLDENDVVCRNPLYENVNLFQLINSIDNVKKEFNQKLYLRKHKKFKSFYKIIKSKVYNIMKRVIFKEYTHYNQY